ncbi:MAG: glycoside hydrolase family 43 protein [Propionicimonas sp.]
MSEVVNPILPGCYPDPSICRVGADYYLVTSTFEYFPGLPVWHSTDLVSWEQVGHVVTRVGQLDYEGIASSGGLYAPTIRHHDGNFWVICTLVDQNEAVRGGNFLMTATDPAGPWSDPVWLDADGIDPSLFFDDDDRIWVHGTRLSREPRWHHQTEVWLREFDPVAGALVGPEHILWNGAMLGVVWAEAPHLYKVDGTYYLLAAEGGTEFHHCVCVARSASVTGPYEGNRSNPILTHRHLGRGMDVAAAGHADLVQAADGSWWAVLLAVRPYGGYHYNLGRETFLVPVVWEDGWPVFAPGEGRVPIRVDVPFASSPPSRAGTDQHAGLVLPSDLRWTSLRRPASGFAVANGDGWRLRMRPETLGDAATPAFLGVRQQHRDVDVGAVLRGSLAPGEEMGVVVRQSEDDHVRLALLTGSEGHLVVQAIHRRAGFDEVLGETDPGLGVDAPVQLGLRVRDQDYALTVTVGDSEHVIATADGRTLDSVATGGFLGLWFGVYATSNGAASTTQVDVDRFEYRPVNPAASPSTEAATCPSPI